LQLVVPTSTRFTAPLLAQPDLSREKSLASRSSLRFTAHTSHNAYYVKWWITYGSRDREQWSTFRLSGVGTSL
jgi:hypothetical protein